MTVVLMLFATIHVFACLLWLVNRVQNFPGSSESCCNFPNGAMLFVLQGWLCVGSDCGSVCESKVDGKNIALFCFYIGAMIGVCMVMD